MKVLESGNPNGAWKKEIVCTGHGNGSDGCGAKLEINASDIFHTAHHDYGGGCDHFMTIECIQCRKWTDIKSSDVPSGVKHNVMNQPTRSSQSRSRSSDNGAK